MPETLLIWDSEQPGPDNISHVYSWNGYGEYENLHSILSYVENNAEELRAKYLAWVHDLGETTIQGKSLIDHLVLAGGMSFWWMTPFVEKSYYQFPISDAIKLLALEKIIKKEKPKKIRLVSEKRWLHQTVKILCVNQQIKYEWQKLKIKQKTFSRERFYQSLPQPCQGLLALSRQLRRAWPFRKSTQPNWFDGKENSIFICGYFANIDREKAELGCFNSLYWGRLPEMFHCLGIKANWLHHNSAVPTDDALNWINKFNQKQHIEGCHAFLDKYLSPRLIFCVLRSWLKLIWVSIKLFRLKQAFTLRGMHLSFWPLMRNYWKSAMRGVFAIDGLLSVELFDAALRDLPHQKRGLYLCENNRWERALIYAWRKHNHGELTAVPHSTVRFWDLRYFADPQIFQTNNSRMVEPHRVALNGNAAKKAYVEANYPQTKIVECEALRYEYLFGEKQTNKNGVVIRSEMRVLILGDFLRSSTIKLLRLIDKAASQLQSSFVFALKPHPLCMLASQDVFRFEFNIEKRPLSEIVSRFDLVIGSNATSAVVDAFLAGLSVIVMIDDIDLNYSPLRHQPGVKFVSTPQHLVDALEALKSGSSAEHELNDFFFLDPDMPRWRKLLASAVN